MNLQIQPSSRKLHHSNPQTQSPPFKARRGKLVMNNALLRVRNPDGSPLKLDIRPTAFSFSLPHATENLFTFWGAKYKIQISGSQRLDALLQVDDFSTTQLLLPNKSVHVQLAITEFGFPSVFPRKEARNKRTLFHLIFDPRKNSYFMRLHNPRELGDLCFAHGPSGERFGLSQRDAVMKLQNTVVFYKGQPLLNMKYSDQGLLIGGAITNASGSNARNPVTLSRNNYLATLPLQFNEQRTMSTFVVSPEALGANLHVPGLASRFRVFVVKPKTELDSPSIRIKVDPSSSQESPVIAVGSGGEALFEQHVDRVFRIDANTEQRLHVGDKIFAFQFSEDGGSLIIKQISPISPDKSPSQPINRSGPQIYNVPVPGYKIGRLIVPELMLHDTGAATLYTHLLRDSTLRSVSLISDHGSAGDVNIHFFPTTEMVLNEGDYLLTNPKTGKLALPKSQEWRGCILNRQFNNDSANWSPNLFLVGPLLHTNSDFDTPLSKTYALTSGTHQLGLLHLSSNREAIPRITQPVNIYQPLASPKSVLRFFYGVHNDDITLGQALKPSNSVSSSFVEVPLELFMKGVLDFQIKRNSNDELWLGDINATNLQVVISRAFSAIDGAGGRRIVRAAANTNLQEGDSIHLVRSHLVRSSGDVQSLSKPIASIRRNKQGNLYVEVRRLWFEEKSNVANKKKEA